VSGRRIFTLEKGATFTSDVVAEILRDLVPGIEVVDPDTMEPYVTAREAGRREFNRLATIARSRGIPVPLVKERA
jgi:hypothetical protein